VQRREILAEATKGIGFSPVRSGMFINNAFVLMCGFRGNGILNKKHVVPTELGFFDDLFSINMTLLTEIKLKFYCGFT
jgi:hypothetical protein